jgi:RND family efflux transporter MFP subunit
MANTTSTLHTKKWYHKKWIYIVGIVVLLIAGSSFASGRKKAQEPLYDTAVVERGALTQTVDAAGNVQSSDELDLRFEGSGRIAKVLVQINEEVEAGTVLAELDLGELNARVAQASANLARTQANLDKINSGETTQYLSNLKAKLDQAEATLSQVRATTNDLIANSEAALATAENNLKLSEGGEESQIVQNEYGDAVSLLVKIQNSIDRAIAESDNILGIDNVFANDAYEDVLSVQDGGIALSNAKRQYTIASLEGRSFGSAANTLSLSTSRADIDKLLVLANSALVSTRDLLFHVSEVLRNTYAIGGMTQTTLDSLKSTISTERSNINTQYGLLITQTQDIQTAKNSYTTSKIAYETAVSNLMNAKLKASADISAYEALAAQARAQYEDAVEPPRIEDVRSAQAQVNEARAQVSAAVASRNKSRIVAPIGGKVAKIAFKSGEYVSSQDVMVKLVSPRFEVEVDIPETDIIKIGVGVSTTLTLDAYGNDVRFAGVVTEIETGETVIQDVVYYRVTVVLEEKPEYQILNGMTADVVFYTEQKEGVLFIPQRAIQSNDTTKTVRVLRDGVVSSVEVITGLRGDDGLVEIISGLSEGDEIVIRERTQ